ncbi:hypothetical protein GE09DRAFT_1056335 [Coniochaeta sp. 2T2.1]|nr:hypothetical protein GE09DRAFT_1056335 [Coniochaeta sp. 2T2.1]
MSDTGRPSNPTEGQYVKSGFAAIDNKSPQTILVVDDQSGNQPVRAGEDLSEKLYATVILTLEGQEAQASDFTATAKLYKAEDDLKPERPCGTPATSYGKYNAFHPPKGINPQDLCFTFKKPEPRRPDGLQALEPAYTGGELRSKLPFPEIKITEAGVYYFRVDIFFRDSRVGVYYTDKIEVL